MENHVTDTALASDMRSAYGRDSTSQMPEIDDLETPPTEASRVEMKRIDALRIPVGTNLADVERWMIFATLQKCGGNKTRAAALLGVSLKTLYNRLNAYRAQGLTMDYGQTTDYQGVDQDAGGGLDARLDVHRTDARDDEGLKGNLKEAQ